MTRLSLWLSSPMWVKLGWKPCRHVFTWHGSEISFEFSGNLCVKGEDKIFLRCRGSNRDPLTCKANILPSRYKSRPVLHVSVSVLYTYTLWQLSSLCLLLCANCEKVLRMPWLASVYLINATILWTCRHAAFWNCFSPSCSSNGNTPMQYTTIFHGCKTC